MASTMLIRGGDGNRGGYSTRGDVLVNKTADGVDLNKMWGELIDATDVYNKQRSAIAGLLSYHTTRPGDAVLQSVRGELFEEATEFGVPTGTSEPNYLKLGYNLKDYDLGLRSTWRYLRDATSEQVQDRVRRIYEADNLLVNSLVLQRLFSPVESTTMESGLTCYGLWNGDGMVPPTEMGKTFDGTHTHYLTTNGTALLASHVEGMLAHTRHHGYGTTQAAQLILFMHPDDVETSGMTSWRAGVTAGGSTPKYDFIVSSSAPAFLTTERVQGTPPPPDYAGLPVLGSYGGALVITSHFIPLHYVALAASGGVNSSDNPVALREHADPDYRGLRLIPGSGPYPLVQSQFARSIGVGVRHRGAAVVCQIVNSATYTEPTFVFTK